MRILACLLFALVLLTGCAGDDPEATSTSIERAASDTSSSAPDRTTTTAETPRTECRGSITSSAATVDADQGTYATYITELDDTTSTVSFDVVQWLAGEDAVEAYHRDNPDDSGGPPNDYMIVNESDRVRSARVEAQAKVWLVRLRTTGDASLKPGSLDELPAYLSQGYPEDVYWLTMSDGSIVDICEQYRP